MPGAFDFGYRFAGLAIASDFELWEAGPADDDGKGEALVMASGPRLGLAPPDGGNARSVDANRARLMVPAVGRFLIEDGRRVIVWPADDVSPATLSQHLTGPVLALALMQRGVLVLHGAVVAIDGRAVVILGHSGDGKSTTAAACGARGHAVLSDDLAPIDVNAAEVTVRSMAALVRVHDAGVSSPDAVSWEAAGKTAVRVGRPPSEAAVSVTAIVTLTAGEAVAWRRLTGATAALTLLDHTYCRTAFQPAQAASALRQCSTVATLCPVVTVTRARRLDQLDALVTCLEDLRRQDW